LVHRLVHPGHEAERARLDELAQSVKHQGARQQEQLGAFSRQLAELGTAVSAQRRELESAATLLREARRDLAAVRSSVDRQRGVASRVLKRVDVNAEQILREERVLERTGRLARSTGPILVGPWTGEVGFELTYWIPFIRWVQQKRGIDPDRLIAVSRGGVSGWYRHITNRYVDLLSFVSPEEYRVRTETVKKQRVLGAFDREIVRRLRHGLRPGRLRLLHPSLMYDLFNPYWKQHATFRRIDDFTGHELLTRPAAADVPGHLPSDFVAVRFYFSTGFPDVPQNRAFVRDTIRRLSETSNVVVLDPGVRVDDHVDYVPGPGERVYSIRADTRPENNLAVQTAVMSRARLFVGTHGGLSYLAPLLGVDSIAFYSDPAAFFTHHVHYAQHAFQAIGGGTLVILNVRDAAQVARVLGPGRAAASVGAD
jgi:hypothetical protein